MILNDITFIIVIVLVAILLLNTVHLSAKVNMLEEITQALLFRQIGVIEDDKIHKETEED